MRRSWSITILLTFFLAACVTAAAQTRDRPPLGPADVDAIAMLLALEDARTYDSEALGRILASAHPEVRRRAAQSVGRIADKRGAALLDVARTDKHVEVAATATWSAGQLRDPSAVAWLREALTDAATRSAVRREAAIALGKIQTPESRSALTQYLSAAPITGSSSAVVGEALLSLGRFPAEGDLAPILRWASSPDVDIRWRAAWALFRPRNPAAVPHLLQLADDRSADVRFWAFRGLIPVPGVDPAASSAAWTSSKAFSSVTR